MAEKPKATRALFYIGGETRCTCGAPMLKQGERIKHPNTGSNCPLINKTFKAPAISLEEING